MEPTGSFCVAFNTSLPPPCPCLYPTTGSSPATYALNVWGLPHHVNTCHPVAQQKLLSSTWAQQCHHRHSGLASPPLPGSSWGIRCPCLWPIAWLRGASTQEPMPSPGEEGGVVWGGVLLHTVGFFPLSLTFPHCYTLLFPWAPSPSADGLQCQHICTSLCSSTPLTFWHNGVAPAWRWATARPLPRRGRQLASPGPLSSLEDVPAAITTAACPAALLPHPAHCALRE